MKRTTPVLVALLCFLLASTSRAETIVLKRGLSLDTWISWPGDEQLAEPGRISGFPDWRAVVSDADLKSIKAAGFDFVRMPIDPAVFLWPANASKRDALTKGLLAALQRVKAADLKVVVDIHAIPVSPGWKSIGTEVYLESETKYSNYLDLVRHIGQAIADEDPARVAIEPMNEPTVDCDFEQLGEKQRWPDMAKRLHQTARAAASRLTLILSGACWGGALGLSRLDPATFVDENIIWSFHNYEPFIYTHQGASWTGGPETYVAGLAYPADRKQRGAILKAAEAKIATADVNKARKAQLVKELRYNLDQYFADGKKEMRDAFARMKSWSKKHNVPPSRIFLGEFGAHRLRTPAEDDDARSRYFDDVRVSAEKAGYAWSMWAWSGTFGIAKTNEGREFSPVIAKALGLP